MTTATQEPEIIDIDDALEIAVPSSAEALVRGEIDIQIATAKRYPRSLEMFQKRAIAMATLDEETAESCIYRRPVGKKKNAKGKWEEEFAEGMSIRMAEIVGACYGNLRVYSTLIEQTPQTVRGRGMAIDLETNFASSSEVIESTLKQDGSPYSPRMRIVVAKATLAKARRDATFQVVPKALAKPIETAVRKVLLGDEKTLEKRRAAVMAWVNKLGIDVARVWAAIGIHGPADLGPEQLLTLTGIRTAIKDNETTIDDAFPELSADQRDHVEEELTHYSEEIAGKLRALFDQKRQSQGQALALLRQHKGQPDQAIAALEALGAGEPSGNKPAQNGADGSSQREARSREMPSATTRPVGGSTPHQAEQKTAAPTTAGKKRWSI